MKLYALVNIENWEYTPDFRTDLIGVYSNKGTLLHEASNILAGIAKTNLETATTNPILAILPLSVDSVITSDDDPIYLIWDESTKRAVEQN